MVRVPDDVPEQEIDKLTPTESIALKTISAIGLVIFTAFMAANWQRSLSENAAAAAREAAEPAVVDSAPPTSASSSAPTTSTPTTSILTSGASANTVTGTETPASSSVQAAILSSPPGASPTSPAVSGITSSAPGSPSETTSSTEPASSISGEISSGSGTVDSGVKITDSAKVEALSKALYDQVDQAWTEVPTFSSNLVYLVKVQEDGEVSGYEPVNKSAIDFLKETPLEKVTSPTAVATDPVAEFVLVLTPTGTLEVSPWLAE
ncbi:MAG: hypothetical protein HC825_04940 [Oscillatoriales cyanobacterium RM1_1_9]|nr:hypothetical protein [Oscillatoriales cyanobacterium SM2_3_0]NJO47571.1 hypothetical protein [Oscillatoriales cyanobacterium RM2_1_1]NJO71216.1 hypothetical protein [Oscillatoriales cyanobacterium RM1_1_9]